MRERTKRPSPKTANRPMREAATSQAGLPREQQAQQQRAKNRSITNKPLMDLGIAIGARPAKVSYCHLLQCYTGTIFTISRRRETREMRRYIQRTAVTSVNITGVACIKMFLLRAPLAT